MGNIYENSELLESVEE
ncbi:hypothetical protein [Streptococcus agalactiae]|nr:hypothetical protein [Streptococcus agalactiae]